MEDEKDTAIKALIVPWIMVAMTLLILTFSLLSAWIVQNMYTWFIVPLGTPQLNVWHVWGILLLWGLFKSNKTNDDNPKKTLLKFGIRVFMSFVVLLIGYIIKSHI